MFVKLLLLFTLVPLLELFILLRLGNYIGAIPTIIIVASTGIIGVSLARQQGFILLTRLKETVSRGEIPTDRLLEGVMILIGGAMLLTPGLITDTLGFALIIPISRAYFLQLARRFFRFYVERYIYY